MNAHTLIKNQHREVENAYDDFTRARGEERTELGKKILTELTVHAEVEEELYYPELEKASGDILAREFKSEHDSMKTLITKLKLMNGDDQDYVPTMKALMDIVEHHVKEEEEEAMPKAEAELDEAALTELGEKMEARTNELRDSTLKRFWAAIT